jgi:prepilin-type N-terminal cleavage/methylation domain-containing protein
MRNTRRIPRRAGFTLVESLIAVTLLGVLFLAVAQTSSRASDAFDEGSLEHSLSVATHRALERLTHQATLANASGLSATLQSSFGDDELEFDLPVDFAGTAVITMSVHYFTELEPGELDDGLDNDGDELVDERQVVEVLAEGQPDERRTVVVSGVAELFDGESANNLDDNGNGLTDEGGLSFSLEEDVLTLRLTCQRRDEGGRLLTKTGETAVRLRNN